jgi:hypothetical protein
MEHLPEAVGNVPQWLLTLIVALAAWMKILAPYFEQRKSSRAGETASPAVTQDPATQYIVSTLREDFMLLAGRLDRHLAAEEVFQQRWMDVIEGLRATNDKIREEIRTDREAFKEELREYRTALYDPKTGLVVLMARALGDRMP